MLPDCGEGKRRERYSSSWKYISKYKEVYVEKYVLWLFVVHGVSESVDTWNRARQILSFSDVGGGGENEL